MQILIDSLEQKPFSSTEAICQPLALASQALRPWASGRHNEYLAIGYLLYKKRIINCADFINSGFPADFIVFLPNF